MRPKRDGKKISNVQLLTAGEPSKAIIWPTPGPLERTARERWRLEAKIETVDSELVLFRFSRLNSKSQYVELRQEK